MSKKKTDESIPAATATAAKEEKTKAATKTVKTKVVSEKAAVKKPSAKKAAGTKSKVAAKATSIVVGPQSEVEPIGAVASASPQPITHDEIARLAYSYAEARGFVGGSPEEDWFRAEQELRRIREM
jgi:hypothetical protein